MNKKLQEHKLDNYMDAMYPAFQFAIQRSKEGSSTGEQSAKNFLMLYYLYKNNKEEILNIEQSSVVLNRLWTEEWLITTENYPPSFVKEVQRTMRKLYPAQADQISTGAPIWLELAKASLDNHRWQYIWDSRIFKLFSDRKNRLEIIRQGMELYDTAVEALGVDIPSLEGEIEAKYASLTKALENNKRREINILEREITLLEQKLRNTKEFFGTEERMVEKPENQKREESSIKPFSLFDFCRELWYNIYIKRKGEK